MQMHLYSGHDADEFLEGVTAYVFNTSLVKESIQSLLTACGWCRGSGA